MNEEIDWIIEFLESKRFYIKFEKNLLENGAKNLFMTNGIKVQKKQKI